MSFTIALMGTNRALTWGMMQTNSSSFQTTQPKLAYLSDGRDEVACEWETVLRQLSYQVCGSFEKRTTSAEKGLIKPCL